jgi:hypothetical protein
VRFPPGNSVAPAGSNRSGGGGNDTAEAFDAKGRLGDPASRQAVTRVNAEQAPKGLMWEPTRRENGEGRRHWGIGGHTPRSDRNQWSHRGIGDGMSAHGDSTQHGKPRSVEARDLQPDAREGQAGPMGVADRLAVPPTPGNSGRGKGPEFKTSVTQSVRAGRLA